MNSAKSKKSAAERSTTPRNNQQMKMRTALMRDKPKNA